MKPTCWPSAVTTKAAQFSSMAHQPQEGALRTSLKVSRGTQLAGALCFIAAIVSGANGGLDGTGFVGGMVALGLLLIVGGKAYEWLSKE